MWRYTLLLFTAITAHSAATATRKINPFGRDLRRLATLEPPLRFVSQDRNLDEVSELWLKQRLDHFANESDSEDDDCDQPNTWWMRYFSNMAHFRPGGPIFIFVGGEWEISPVFLQTGHMYDIARQHGGAMFYTEHRFYGRSWPAGNASVENLRFLSVRQSLADLAHFIAHQRAHSADLNGAQVILVGGSYSGSMVAWFDRIYPHVISAAWASSAPVRAKLNFHEYMQLAGEAIALEGGRECSARLAAGMAGIEDLLLSPLPTAARRALFGPLRVCDNFNVTRPLDVATLFNGIGNHFAAIVQQYSSRIAGVCAHLLAPEGDPTTAVIEYLARVFWPLDGRADESQTESYCFDFTFEAMRDVFADVGGDGDNADARPWFYQTCNEFGWYATTARATTHRPSGEERSTFARRVPLEYFQRLCEAVFGSGYTLPALADAVAHTNAQFAGPSTAPQGAANRHRNVFFTHGALDPWRAVGQQSSAGGQQNVIIIPGYSHTADLGSIDFADSVDLNVAKLKVAAFLRRRLRQRK